MATRRDARACPWRGVSLGGWLILEPGPAHPLFSQYPDPKSDTGEARCEWDFLKLVEQQKGKKKAAEIIRKHRESHITKADFEKIRACGLNAVRVPFGYWVVMGPSPGEPYQGPALEYVDKAVDWAEQCGLQVMLDLHGCPGGESGEAPCGRRQRPDGTWKWKQWRFSQTLKAIEIVARRYQNRSCVTGIAVCNEPSNEVPQGALCRFYERAITIIRKAGMACSRVAVVLPLFQRPEDPFMEYWQKLTHGRHKNICFDVHCYHCFENEFNGKTLAQHLRYCRENAEMLRRYPMVVGEWSLALGVAAWATCGDMEQTNVQQLFCSTQLEAFADASHGHFFWNWTDTDSAEWNYQTARDQGCFSGPKLALPKWKGTGEDPLEERLNPSPSEPEVFFGDTIYLRTFYGRYVDAEGTRIQARWADKGVWQEFAFRHATDAPSVEARRRCKIHHGDAVRLLDRHGRFLMVKDECVSATRQAAIIRRDPTAVEFVVHLENRDCLKHRGIVYLQSRATAMMLDADADADGLFARFPDRGEWQQFAIEKTAESSATPKKRCASRVGVRAKGSKRLRK